MWIYLQLTLNLCETKEMFNFHARDTVHQLVRILYVEAKLTRNLFHQCFTLQWFSPPPNHYVISFNKTTSQTTYTQSSNHPRQAKRPVSCCNIHPSEHVERFTWFSTPHPHRPLFCIFWASLSRTVTWAFTWKSGKSNLATPSWRGGQHNFEDDR